MIRGEIWWVDFGIPFGSEPGYKRPVVIIQNDLFNESNMNTTIIIPLTTNIRYADFPGNTFLSSKETKLSKDSVALTVQITTIDKARLRERVNTLSIKTMKKITENLKLVLDIQ